MATVENNRISVDVTDSMIEKVKEAMKIIDNVMPFLIGLTPEERQMLPKINVVNNVFVNDALTAARNNAHILPSYLKVDELQKDKTGFDKIDELVLLTAQQAQKFSDTQMLMGSESFKTALTMYRLFESAARDGVPGAQAVYDLLAERFNGQGKTTENTTPEKPAE